MSRAGRGSAIVGWGQAVPDTIVTNDDLSEVLDTSDAWIRERTGIGERRVLWGRFGPRAGTSTAVGPLTATAPLGTTATLAVDAGRAALASAGLGPLDIDLLVLCTSTPDQTVPATSASVAAALGLRCGAFDLNTACSGFVYGLLTADAFVGFGMDRVLLIGAESCSRITDWDDRATAILFGDGAGAIVLEAVLGRGGLQGADFGTDGSLQSILFADVCGTFQMEGKEVFRRAVRAVVQSARSALSAAGAEAADVDVFVAHQANARIIEAVCARLSLPLERAVSILEHTGNTSAASIPMALATAVTTGRLADGDLLLISGFGAGMAWGSIAWRWGRPAPLA